MKHLNRITNLRNPLKPLLVLCGVSVSLLFSCQPHETGGKIIEETKNECLQKLYIKAIDEQLFYSEKYNDALKELDFEKMREYNDNMLISFEKARFIYNEMYPNNAR